jgi:hypothetical protein
MATRQSFYLIGRADDFVEPAPPSGLDCDDIPYITAANDNDRVKDRLSARCRALLRRLISSNLKNG